MIVRYWWTEDGEAELCERTECVLEENSECYHCLAKHEKGARVSILKPLYDEDTYVMCVECADKSTQLVDNRVAPYEVIEEIDVLREFAFGLMADVDRVIDDKKVDEECIKLLRFVSKEVLNMYHSIFKIKTLKDAYVCRGKLQMVNSMIKELEMK